jgi:hypothetical protein
MSCIIGLSKRFSPSEFSKLETARLLYSSRADRSKLIRELATKRIKRKEKSCERRPVTKILVAIPMFETESSERELNLQSPNFKQSLSRVKRRRRLIFKSDIEKVYNNKPFFM